MILCQRGMKEYVRRGAKQFSRLQYTEAICLTPEKKNPCQDKHIDTHKCMHIQILHVSFYLPVFLSQTRHGHLGTEVSYLKAKSYYGFQIPLCKRFHVSFHGLCMYFLIQDKSSRSVRCILSLPEGCLNRCAVCIKQFDLAGFHNVLQHNVFPKSIIADNVKLYTSNEYMHTANGMKSSNRMKIFDSTLCWLK